MVLIHYTYAVTHMITEVSPTGTECYTPRLGPIDGLRVVLDDVSAVTDQDFLRVCEEFGEARYDRQSFESCGL